MAKKQRGPRGRFGVLKRVVDDLPSWIDERDRSWMVHAECRGLDPNLFYPERGYGDVDARNARAVCMSCPVIWQCLEYGFAERYGIWGGLTDRQRVRVKMRVVRGQMSLQRAWERELGIPAPQPQISSAAS